MRREQHLSWLVLLLLMASAVSRAQAQEQPAPIDTAAQPASDVQAQLKTLSDENHALQARVEHMEQAQADATAAELASSAGADVDQSYVTTEPFRVYGFADFGLNHAWLGSHSFLDGVVPTATTFTLGNLNMYFDFKPGEAWQVLTELRFSTYPDGVEESYGTPLGGVYKRTSTDVIDVASPATASRFHWGTVAIERAYAQYTASEKLSVRVGQFLTPYGIWNVDHGTPTLIALMMPHFVSAQVLPARQVGVEAHGAFLSASWEYGYNAYISNGRTAAPLDFTENKALGGRLRMSRLRPFPMTLGASFYYGQIDDIAKNITSFAPFTVKRDLIVNGTEWAVGADVSIDLDALRIRAEGVMRNTRYDDGKHPPLEQSLPGTTKPNNNEYDGYVLAAYQLPWLGLEPFAYGELNHFVSPYGDEQAALSLGLNIHFTPYAQLKTQLAKIYFFDLNDNGNFAQNNFTLLFSRLAVAF